LQKEEREEKMWRRSVQRLAQVEKRNWRVQTGGKMHFEPKLPPGVVLTPPEKRLATFFFKYRSPPSH